MTRLLILLIGLSVWFAIDLSDSVKATGCGESPPAAESKSFELASGQSLYGFDRKGTFYRGDFNGSSWHVIQSHSLQGINATISPDGRWVAYGGDKNLPYEQLIGDKRAEELWLFDRETGQTRLILQRPFASLMTVKASFSPDSRRLVTFSDYDERTPNDLESGLYLFDLHSGTARHLGYSHTPSTGGEESYGNPSWAVDGRLFLYYRGDSTRYLLVDAETGASTDVEGRYDERRHDHEFIENGKPIVMLKQHSTQSRLMISTLDSPDGSSRARIDENRRLWIEANGHPDMLVAKGGYNDCEGQTIGILGWLQGDHLVYANAHAYFVFDIRRRQSRRLDLGPVDASNFFWLNP
ncbi:MAG: hypothetical protein ABL934_03400 [Lysobacteraceae bacterium]